LLQQKFVSWGLWDTSFPTIKKIKIELQTPHTYNRIYTAIWKEMETTHQQTEMWQDSRVYLKISNKMKRIFEKTSATILFHILNCWVLHPVARVSTNAFS
jgi:hypothetical protein